ncbi:MAG: hypothetical protein HQL50_04000 [Magnetococcales bacterium]|nr:hypothetical protein [Magnetococcales bacterium]
MRVTLPDQQKISTPEGRRRLVQSLMSRSAVERMRDPDISPERDQEVQEYQRLVRAVGKAKSQREMVLPRKPTGKRHA